MLHLAMGFLGTHPIVIVRETCIDLHNVHIIGMNMKCVFFFFFFLSCAVKNKLLPQGLSQGKGNKRWFFVWILARVVIVLCTDIRTCGHCLFVRILGCVWISDESYQPHIDESPISDPASSNIIRHRLVYQNQTTESPPAYEYHEGSA